MAHQEVEYSLSQKHMVIDIETSGKRPGCAVLQIGVAAIILDAQKEYSTVEKLLEVNLCHHTQRDTGFVDDPDTVHWWISQGPEKYNSVWKYGGHPVEQIKRYIQVYDKLKPDYIWCTGTDFDIPILRHLFYSYGFGEFPLPHYGALRDLRTLRGIFPEIFNNWVTTLDIDKIHSAGYDAYESAELLRRYLIQIQLESAHRKTLS